MGRLPDSIPKSNADLQGQVLVEWLVSLWVAFLLFIAMGHHFLKVWERMKCAHLAFETAQKALYSPMIGSEKVKIKRTQEQVQCVAHCGEATVEVHLPLLEYAQW